MLAVMVWGGAVLDVIARLRRERPDLASRRSSVRPGDLAWAGSRETFPCLYLCDACGYLADTQAPCPACRQLSWIDLNLWAHAHALREREEAERQNPSPEVRWQVRLAALAIGGGLGTGIAAGLAAAGLVTLGWPALLVLGAGATAATGTLGRRKLGWSIMARRVQWPTRWRLPLPLADDRAPIATRAFGPADPRGGLLTAPFSGRPCLAYEVAVLFDTPNDAWPPIWVLREQRSCAFEVDHRVVEADAAALASPIEQVTAPTIGEAALSKFLRERGLFLTDGQFDLFEAILPPGAACELQWPATPDGAPPFVRNVRALARPGAPYR